MIVKSQPKRFTLVKFGDLERSSYYVFEVCPDGEVRVSFFSPSDSRMEFGAKVPAEEARKTWKFLTSKAQARWTLWE
jgi:hypothetical protein